MAELSIEEFLGHTTDGGGKGKRLKSWKKTDKKSQIDTFIHPRSKVIPVWQHAWFQLKQFKNADTGNVNTEVWADKFNSWESETLLKDQYFREPKRTGPRVTPLELCPMSLMLEAVFQAVQKEYLDWTDEVFRFEGSDPSKAQILHAGGMYNAFGAKWVTDEQKEEIKEAGISLRHSWRENCQAKCFFVFSIVDVENVHLGTQVTTEGKALGDKVKGVIGKRMEELGDEEGNPALNPYCIRWKRDPDQQFDKIYDALGMSKIEVTEEIQAVFDKPIPDVSFLTKRGNIKRLRDSMEFAYVGPEGLLDWDEIFEPAEAELAALEKGESSQDENPIEVKSKPAKPSKARKAAKEPKRSQGHFKVQHEEVSKEPDPDESGDIPECDKCGEEMGCDDLKCDGCGAEYDPDTFELIEKKPAKKRGGKKKKAGDRIKF